MSETMREAIPIIVMYGFVLLLAPFIGFALWMAFDGDRVRAQSDVDAPTAEAATAPTTIDAQPKPQRAITTASSAA